MQLWPHFRAFDEVQNGSHVIDTVLQERQNHLIATECIRRHEREHCETLRTNIFHQIYYRFRNKCPETKS